MDAITDTPLVKPLPRRRDNPWLRRVLVFATVVVFVDAILGEHGLVETMRARHQYEQAAAQLSEMRQENGALRERIRRLYTDPREIEAEARRQLGLIKPGEVLFVVRDR